MANEPRFVFDANGGIRVLLLRYSAACQAFDRATQKGNFLITLATVEELNDVLQRKGFEKYITEEERMEFLSAICQGWRLGGDCRACGGLSRSQRRQVS